ncbi:hypothetical protein [Antarcticimicrobium sediminis]|uniref:Uncharacterized protein n=1 Tax=Antarcticimicrobium sediminis TaxID=2546227 RepID=A0A4R5EIF5_9RHOB|nr:hypothetical protein [Antarcticimicrobium sediminis]TDE34150.1 hypothetical protein E1B25_20385 [Antarcticimicrobium sediminis]
MKRPILTAALIALAVTAGQASAQWLHQEQGSAFDAQKTQIALTSQGQYAVGLRCTGADDLTVIFITPEAIDQDSLKMLNIAAPEILVRIDQNAPYAIKAEGDNPEGKLTLHAAAPPSLARELIAATSSISVAARLLGSLYHEKEFSVRGSTGSVTKLANLCGLPNE